MSLSVADPEADVVATPRSAAKGPRHARVSHRGGSTTADRASGERMGIGRSTLIALGSLALVAGIAFGVLTGVGAILHAVNPAKHFDTFYVLHNEIVVGTLIALSLLWLLPPHPWAKRLVEKTGRKPATAGRAGGGGSYGADDQLDGSGLGTVPRPAEERWW